MSDIWSADNKIKQNKKIGLTIKGNSLKKHQRTSCKQIEKRNATQINLTVNVWCCTLIKTQVKAKIQLREITLGLLRVDYFGKL